MTIINHPTGGFLYSGTKAWAHSRIPYLSHQQENATEVAKKASLKVRCAIPLEKSAWHDEKSCVQHAPCLAGVIDLTVSAGLCEKVRSWLVVSPLQPTTGVTLIRVKEEG